MAGKKKAVGVVDHVLIPKHEKLSEKEKKELFERYKFTGGELPIIGLDDPSIDHLDVKKGDVVRITRPSATAGTSMFYREVAHV